MLRLPSLQSLSGQLRTTLYHYPWVILMAVLKAVFTIWLSETGFDQTERLSFISRILYVAYLGLPLALALRLWSVRRQWASGKEMVFNIILVCILVGYYFTISIENTQIDFYRCALFTIAAHLLVSFIAFSGFSEPNGFWQFNKTLFLQFLNATLYALTLYLGLLVAVETVRFLFDVEYSFRIEMDLSAIVFLIFHTIFFLNKIPLNLSALEQQTGYPTGLKIFTQYVLLPLEVVYLIILYTYTGKIALQWQLPEGGVAYLVLAFSTAGILALLLLYPLRDSPQERWVTLFSKRFYLALLPLIILLFAGIFRRIHDYGITENRYLVAVLACWLAGITAYFLLSKKADIRWVPITLAVICVVLPIGPWNIFKIARESQSAQFHSLLTEYKLLDAKGKITRKTTMPQEDLDRLASIIQFFQRREEVGLETYFPKLPTTRHEIRKRKDKWQHYNAMEAHLRQYVTVKDGQNGDQKYQNYSSSMGTPEEQVVDISQFGKLIPFNSSEGVTDTDSSALRVSIAEKSEMLDLYRGNAKIASFDLSKKMLELSVKHGFTSSNVPAAELSLDYQQDNVRIRVVIRSVSKSGKHYYCDGYILY